MKHNLKHDSYLIGAMFSQNLLCVTVLKRKVTDLEMIEGCAAGWAKKNLYGKSIDHLFVEIKLINYEMKLENRTLVAHGHR